MYKQRIVIVGAGIVGLSTAYALLKQGAPHVTVLEQATVDHRRSTSHGLSRLLRFEYGDAILYSKLVQLSFKKWQALERSTGQTLCTPTRVLVLGNEGDNFTQTSYRNLRDLGLPIELLSRQSLKQRFPQFNSQGYDQYTYNSSAAILHASTCLQTLKQLILDMGGTIFEGHHVRTISYEAARLPLRIHCSNGETIIADRVAVALGPWVHTLLGSLQLPIRATRQHLLYFGNLSPTMFGESVFPAFLSGELYGFPLHSSFDRRGPNWLKVASHSFGTVIDPNQPPQAEEHIIAQVKKKACELLPALRQATLEQVDTCMYDVSPDEGFILDYHPHNPRIVFATGLTGHGFKFGPLLGEMLSSLVRDAPPPVCMESFQLSRFTHHRLPQHSSVA